MKIIINNLKKEEKYQNIVEDYKLDKITLRQAYQKVLEVSNNKLSDAMGELYKDRTGTGTWKISSGVMNFDISEKFPLITTKFTSFKTILNELLWFISGDTNIKGLLERKCKIWCKDAFRNYVDKNDLWEKYPRNSDEFNKAARGEFSENVLSDEEFAKKWGDLGPVYGAQWRNFGGYQGLEGVDQLQNMIDTLKTNPYDRRMLVFAYNPQEKHLQSLPPCHIFYQAIVLGDQLDLCMHMRSNDMFLGSPFNIASYAILQNIIAKEVGLKPGKLTITIGDCHMYSDHIDQVQEQLSREFFAPPTIEIDDNVPFDKHTENTIKILDYQHHKRITAEMST